MELEDLHLIWFLTLTGMFTLAGNRELVQDWGPGNSFPLYKSLSVGWLVFVTASGSVPRKNTPRDRK